MSPFLAALSLALAPGSQDAVERSLAPNIVLVVWTTPEADSLELAGPADGSTPTLDRLARAAALFPAGVVPVPRGRPERAALLTGLYPHQSGLYYRQGPDLELADTLPRVLGRAGYATFHAGRGENGGHAAIGFEQGAEDVLETGSAALLGFVEDCAGKRPLFVCWAPAVPPARAPGKRAAGERESPRQRLDGGLAQLVGALEQRGELANTLFAFVTGAEPRGTAFLASECLEREQRSPIFLAFEGRIPAGVREEPASALDLYPTVLDYAGVPCPAGRPGRSLRGLLAGEPWEPRAVGAAFFEPRMSPRARTSGELQRDLLALTLRDGPWKYTLFLEDSDLRADRSDRRSQAMRTAGDQSLFDLEHDPEEAVELVWEPAHGERVRALREQALEWWRATGGAELSLPYLTPELGPPPAQPRPNIVLVLADDMDHEHLGFLGNPLARTPTLDALARDGFVFPVAHVPVSRCRPSHAALLTGRWPHQTRVYDNKLLPPVDRRDALPNLLKAAGYACFAGGKFWEGRPQSMGFLAPAVSDLGTLEFVREGQEELFAFVDRHARERPLFIWWAPILPHLPHDPPPELRALFTGAEIPVPDGSEGDPAAFREAERRSYAMEAWLDEGLRGLREKLASAGELEDTLFVFLIDNGWANGFPSKGTAFERGLRTPVVFSWPRGIAGGRTSPYLVSTLDVPSTILDFAGVPAPVSYLGTSLRPLLEGRELAPRPVLHGALYRDHGGEPDPARDVFALYARTERWKLVYYLSDVSDTPAYDLKHEFAPFPARRRGDRDLYDLAQDPHEQRDLAGDPAHAPLVEELQAGTLAWWRETGGGELDLP